MSTNASKIALAAGKLLLSSSLLFECSNLHADFIQVPSGSGSINGSTFSYEPFNLRVTESSSLRFQQVYASDAFSGIAAGGALITGIYFKPEPGLRPFGNTLPSVEILMSTTPRGPDSLNPVFAGNLGIRTLTVFPRGPLTIGGSGGFDIRVFLQTPYFYRPADGNLLLEVRNYAPEGPPGPGSIVGPFDAESALGDPISRVYAYDVNATIGTTDTLGLFTGFAVTVIPEPSAFALFACAGGVVLWWRHRRILTVRH